MRPNAKNLAMRDMAMAALIGVVGQPGADFGVEFGDDGDESYDPNENPTYGTEFGVEFGDDYGADWGADPVKAAPTNVRAIVAAEQQRAVATKRREMLLEPNKGSAVKIQRYSFAINQGLVLGAAAALVMTGQPDTHIRPQRVTMNAPSNGFCTISEIKVANVSVTVGGVHDAFDFSAIGVGQALDMPTLTPANRASVLGAYTGFVPTGFVGGAAYTFVASFKGPAYIVA